jgi:hypothetical protein
MGHLTTSMKVVQSLQRMMKRHGDQETPRRNVHVTSKSHTKCAMQQSITQFSRADTDFNFKQRGLSLLERWAFLFP